jgi:hypothetical protein
MADPVVHITNGLPDLGTGNITTLGLTIPPAGTTTTSVQGGPMAQGAVTSAPPTYITGQVNALSLTTGGLLRVDGSGATQPISGSISGTVTANQGGAPWTMKPDGTAWAMTSTSANVNVTNTVPVSGTFWQATQPVSGTVTVQQPTAANLNATVTGSVSITGTPTVTANQGGAPWSMKPDGTVWTLTSTSANVNLTNASVAVTGTFWQATQPVSGTFWQATQPVSIAATVNTSASQSGTWTVQRIQNANSTGLTQTRVVAAATTNATSLKASAGNIAAIDLFNVATYMVFLKLYNKASAPTVGTDTPVWTIPLPASGGFSIDFSQGEYFSTGIAFAITKLQADSDTTVLVAGDVTGRIKWV